MRWINEPKNWCIEDKQIIVRTEEKTDFWRKTHYDFICHNGHFYFEHLDGDFEMQVKITGNYRDLYDQAGLMLRYDDKTWIKCGIEYVSGVQQASVVVTRDYSDWSVVPLRDNPISAYFKLAKMGNAVEISCSYDGSLFEVIRLTYYAGETDVGIMCASPHGKGFDVIFEDFRIVQTDKRQVVGM